MINACLLSYLLCYVNKAVAFSFQFRGGAAAFIWKRAEGGRGDPASRRRTPSRLELPSLCLAVPPCLHQASLPPPLPGARAVPRHAGKGEPRPKMRHSTRSQLARWGCGGDAEGELQAPDWQPKGRPSMCSPSPSGTGMATRERGAHGGLFGRKSAIPRPSRHLGLDVVVLRSSTALSQRSFRQMWVGGCFLSKKHSKACTVLTPVRKLLTSGSWCRSANEWWHRRRELWPPSVLAAPREGGVSTTDVVAGGTGFVQRERSGVAGKAEHQA